MLSRSGPGQAAAALALVVLVGCTPATAPSTPSQQGPGASAETARPRGTLKIAWTTEPENLHSKLSGGRGLSDFFWVFNSFLTYYDFAGASHPMIAREIPSRENGDWVIHPDGTMVTTYRLRENARWHDGTALTAADFVLGYQVAIDPELPIRDRTPETLMSHVQAPDPRTLVVTWKEPYVAANRLTFQQLTPIPRHLVDEKYRSNKANFVFGEEWTSSYVGTGPFRLDRWIPGAGMTARANTDWVLGPPKLEALDIRFIPDARAQLANFLSGEVDLISSPGIEPTEAAAARDHWGPTGQGSVKTWTRNIRYLEFQFREVANWQPVVADARVRRALVHAIDRKGLVDVVNHGLGSTADAFIAPAEALFAEVDRVIAKYPFDPNRAAVVLAEAGWRPASPGGLAVNAAGTTLDIDLWTTAGGGAEQEASIIADGWRAVGIGSAFSIIPSARQRDNEFRVGFPAVNLTSRSVTLDDFVFTSGHVPTAEVRWQGANRGSFRDAEIDHLRSLAVTSLVEDDRRQAVIALHRRMSELVGIAPLFYGVGVILTSGKVKGPIGEVVEKSGMSWNIFEWEMSA